MGYFQIAGIHGWPKQSWNDVGGKNLNRSNDSGYCAHALTTFPTWHRPYLVMFEQALFLQMVDIADRYSDPQVKTDYQAAALKLRLPFWDYYRPRGGSVTFSGIIDDSVQTTFPYNYKVLDVFTETTLMARQPPDNTLQPLDRNPFNYFGFNSTVGVLSHDDWGDLTGNKPLTLNTERTVRHSFDSDHPKTFEWDLPDRMNNVLNEPRMDANRVVLDMIDQDYYKSYDSFASQRVGKVDPTKAPESGALEATREAYRNSGSLEAIHGLYHGLVGGGGHMGRVAVAAFDPIYILVPPRSVHSSDTANSWFDKDPTRAKADLLPFMHTGDPDRTKATYWKSESVKQAAGFGYQFEDILSSTTETRKRFEDLYRWSVPKERTGAVGKHTLSEMEPLEVTKTEFFPKDTLNDDALQEAPTVETFSEVLAKRAQVVPIEPGAEQTVTKGDIYEWFVVMRLNGPSSRATLAGISYIFAAPREGCDNCGRQAEQALIVRDTSAITSQLLDYVAIGHIESMTPEHVKPFLVDRLRWRIVTVNGETIDPRAMKRDHSLKTGISAKRTSVADDVPEVTRYDDIIDTIIQNASATPSVTTQG